MNIGNDLLMNNKHETAEYETKDGVRMLWDTIARGFAILTEL